MKRIVILHIQSQNITRTASLQYQSDFPLPITHYSLLVAIDYVHIYKTHTANANTPARLAREAAFRRLEPLAWTIEGLGTAPVVPEEEAPAIGMLSVLGVATGPPGIMDDTGVAGLPELKAAAPEVGAASVPPGIIDVTELAGPDVATSVPPGTMEVTGPAVPDVRTGTPG